MQRVLLALTLLASLSASAQKEELFGNGKPPVFRQERLDRTFNKSRLAKALDGAAGSSLDNPGCAQLVGGLLIALGELAPSLHKRDENFFLDPVLVDAVNSQLSTPRFPAMAYLVSMVRRVMLDKRLPDAWLETAKQLNTAVKIIDLARLKQLNDGVVLVDSAYFQIPTLKARYFVEVAAANSAVTDDVARSFHDTYVDRQIAWAGVTFLDAGLNTPKGKKPSPSEMADIVAILEYVPPDPRKTVLDLTGKNFVKPPPIRVVAHLAPKQYFDLEKAFKGQRMLVKGEFHEMDRSMTTVEITKAMLFDDRDWGAGAVLGRPEDVDQCPLATNDLTGLNPNQPGGFRH